MTYHWLGDFLYCDGHDVGELYKNTSGAWSWLLYADHDKLRDEEFGEAPSKEEAMIAAESAERARRAQVKTVQAAPSTYHWLGNFLFLGVDRCVGEIWIHHHAQGSQWNWLLYSDFEHDLPNEELGEAATGEEAAAALEAADRLRRHPAGEPTAEVRDSVVSREGAVRPDGGVAAQPGSVEPGASLLAEGVGHRRPVEGDRKPDPAGAPPAPAAQPLPATSGSDSAASSVPPTDPSSASARSPEVVGSGALEAWWVALGAWRACPSPGCVLRVDHDGEHRKWPKAYQPPLRSPAPENGVASDPTTLLDPPRLRPPLQPAPSGGEGDCWRELIDALPAAHPLRQECEERRRLGIERYGQPLRRGDGRSASRDLRDELLDAAVYAWRLGYEDLALELIDTAQQWVGEAPYRFRGTEDVEPEDESRELRLDIAEWRRDRGVP